MPNPRPQSELTSEGPTPSSCLFEAVRRELLGPPRLGPARLAHALILPLARASWWVVGAGAGEAAGRRSEAPFKESAGFPPAPWLLEKVTFGDSAHRTMTFQGSKKRLKYSYKSILGTFKYFQCKGKMSFLFPPRLVEGGLLVMAPFSFFW